MNSSKLKAQVVSFFSRFDNKSRKFAAILLLIILLTLIWFIFPKNSVVDSDIDEVAEPEAELATDVLSESIELNTEEADIDEETLQNISNYTNSPDGSTSIVISNNENSVDNQLYSLTLVDSAGKVLKQIEKGNVTNARYVNKNLIYYQIVGNGAGVYLYSIKDGTKKLITYTYDSNAFENLLPIDASKYFFIQTSTGKVGFGTIGQTAVTILDEKLLDTDSNYIRTGAFKYSSLSPDKKYIVFYDLVGDSDNKVGIKIYKTDATKKEDLYFETRLNYPVGGFNNLSDIFSWSKDSSKLAAGSNGVVIDVSSKTVISQTKQDEISKISPDQSKLIRLEYLSGKARVEKIDGSDSKEIFAGVSQIEWLSNSRILFVVGKGLYIYDTQTNKITKATDQTGIFKILSINTDTSKALLTIDGKAIELSMK